MFNTGIYDAKGLHHPTVTALQQGRAYPRNRVVGWAWFYAHEWVRANLRLIVDTLRRTQNIDLEACFGLLPKCYEGNVGYKESEPAMWSEHFPSLGTARHAFPRFDFAVASFCRTLQDRQFLFATTDGDLAMFRQLVEGFGNGNAMLQRNGETRAIDGCSYHKLAALRKMINLSARILRGRRNADVDLWDKKHSAGHLLSGTCDVFHTYFGDYTDETMQHDVFDVALVMWELALELAQLMGDDPQQWNKNHHPVTGLCGVWGRMMRTYEAAEGVDLDDHPLARMVKGTVHVVMSGDAPSANALEANLNRKTSEGVQCATSIGPLMTKLSGVWKNASRNCIAQAGYSLLPDFFGLNMGTTSTKQTGRGRKVPTSKDMPRSFSRGVSSAITAHQNPGTYYKVGTGEGVHAEYIVASATTVATVQKLHRYLNPHGPELPTVGFMESTLRQWRKDWLSFIRNPRQYITTLRNDAKEMDVVAARQFMLDREWPGRGRRFTRDPYQVHAIVATGAMFNCGAFHRVVPRKHLSVADSKPLLQESFRRYNPQDPWDRDVRMLQCLHCNQWSKYDYCEHVAAVTVLEGIIPGLPRTFMCRGIEDALQLRRLTEALSRNKYGSKRVVDEATQHAPSNTHRSHTRQRFRIPKHKKLTKRNSTSTD